MSSAAGIQVLLDSRLFVGGGDFSGSGNKIELSEEFESKGTTNWRSGGAETVLGGLAKVACSAEGQWEAGDPGKVDDRLWDGRRALEPWSWSGEGESDLAAGNKMYLSKMLRTKSNIGGAVGDVAAWSAEAVGTWPLVKGKSAHASGVPRTASGTGTSLNLGAVAANKFLYVNLHVLSVSGTATPTITVTPQSDSATGFPSATDLTAFAAATGITNALGGGQAIRIAGPLTDTWFRVKWTITGTNPSFLFLVSMGIE